jgi:hypothetical protein
MPDSTPMTKLYFGGRLWPQLRAMAAAVRTMPMSKHSNSGSIVWARIAPRNLRILSTELSNRIGGQAQDPSARVFR